ncbi:hypothetical protein P22_2307 [Propionispora sp. 2/2-37]|nr:hypothetical protein P22_2307 [Propionispora sp. 2/2-37]
MFNQKWTAYYRSYEEHNGIKIRLKSELSGTMKLKISIMHVFVLWL